MSLQGFFNFAPCFLIFFSSFSNFLLNCVKEFFAGLGLILPFLVAWKLVFPIHLSLILLTIFCVSIVYALPCLAVVAMLLKANFLWESCSTRSLVFFFFTLVGIFLVGLCVECFLCTYSLYSLKRHKKWTYVHGSHTFLAKVEMVPPGNWALLNY